MTVLKTLHTCQRVRTCRVAGATQCGIWANLSRKYFGQLLLSVLKLFCAQFAARINRSQRQQLLLHLSALQQSVHVLVLVSLSVFVSVSASVSAFAFAFSSTSILHTPVYISGQHGARVACETNPAGAPRLALINLFMRCARATIYPIGSEKLCQQCSDLQRLPCEL